MGPRRWGSSRMPLYVSFLYCWHRGSLCLCEQALNSSNSISSLLVIRYAICISLTAAILSTPLETRFARHILLTCCLTTAYCNSHVAMHVSAGRQVHVKGALHLHGAAGRCRRPHRREDHTRTAPKHNFVVYYHSFPP